MTCPPCTHDCREGRDCPLIAFNAEVVGYVKPQRTWVDLTPKDLNEIFEFAMTGEGAVHRAIAKFKEKNT